MLNKIILASKSKVRKNILDKHNIFCEVKPSNVDEDIVKAALIRELASPEIISKNLAELKANKVSLSQKDEMVLGADSVIDLDGELISKPENREEALVILKKLNGKKHNLISSVCISKNGSMVWNYTGKAELTMKNFLEQDLKDYLSRISDKNLYSGMYVHGNILVGENENSFSIKRSLLNNNKIYIIKDNILIEKEINIIQIIEERAIIKGLDNGDEILSEPIKGSYSGMNIRIQNK